MQREGESKAMCKEDQYGSKGSKARNRAMSRVSVVENQPKV